MVSGTKRRRVITVFIIITAAAAGVLLAAFPNLRKTWYLPKRSGFVAFMYHHVEPNGAPDPFTVAPEMLEKHILFLKEKGYTPVSLKELQGNKSVKKPVMLTFDDGYADNYTHLFPLLKKYNVPAVIFLITDKIGSEGFLTWEQIREMKDSGLVEFGSHTRSHRRLRSLPDEEIVRELVQSKQILEEKLGEPVTAFCYPFGAGGFDKRVRPQVFKAGYAFDFSTKKGVNPWPWNPEKTLRRAFPRGGETLFDYHLQLTRGQSKL